VAKSGKITFSPLETKKTSFFANIFISLIFILIFEPETKSVERKHTLSAQHRLIIPDTERLVMALVVGPQDYRHLFANSQHFVQHYTKDTFLT